MTIFKYQVEEQNHMNGLTEIRNTNSQNLSEYHYNSEWPIIHKWSMSVQKVFEFKNVVITIESFKFHKSPY